MNIETVMEQHEDYLLGLPNVVGTAIGEVEGEPVIKVFVSRKVPEIELEAGEVVPNTLGGYRIDVEVTGEIRPA